MRLALYGFVRISGIGTNTYVVCAVSFEYGHNWANPWRWTVHRLDQVLLEHFFNFQFDGVSKMEGNMAELLLSRFHGLVDMKLYFVSTLYSNSFGYCFCHFWNYWFVLVTWSPSLLLQHFGLFWAVCVEWSQAERLHDKCQL